MQFPQAPEIGDEVTNELTGAVYRWDGLMWHNVPQEWGWSVDEGKLEQLGKHLIKTQLLIEEETRHRQEGDNCLQDGVNNRAPFEYVDQLETNIRKEIGWNTAAIADNTSDISELQKVEPYDDGPMKEQMTGLQEGFDAALIAAQEGAENLTIELASYSKKTHNHDGAYSAKDHGHDYLPLKGGTLSGTVNGKLIKSTRDTGYAFEVKPGDTTKAYIHTDGHAGFHSRIEIDGKKVALEDHSHSGDFAAADHTHDYATPGHNHNSLYVKGNWTITKSSGNWYIS